MIAVFLDVNVIIDFMDASAQDHKTTCEAMQILRQYFGKPMVSPYTFIIANYLFSKHVKDKTQHREKMQFVFTGFVMTPVAASAIDDIFSSRFLDLEDAAQYQCALQGKAELILTKDVHDFFPSKIPVIHPHDFVNRYNNLLA